MRAAEEAEREGGKKQKRDGRQEGSRRKRLDRDKEQGTESTSAKEKPTGVKGVVRSNRERRASRRKAERWGAGTKD